MKSLVAFLRERGIRLVIYLGDVLILASFKDLVSQHLNLVFGFFTSLDFLVFQAHYQNLQLLYISFEFRGARGNLNHLGTRILSHFVT